MRELRTQAVLRSKATLLVAALLAGCGAPNVSDDEPVPPVSGESGGAEPGGVDADAPEEFTETDSGLKYRIRRAGTGEKPDPSDTVTVHYKGWLDDGSVFDSSYERGEPATFALNQVVAGWTEGLQHVSEGGMIELEIPSELAYGEQGRPGIPPNARLHFLVELLSIED